MNTALMQPLEGTLPGAVLAAPVTDGAGTVLLPAGLSLTAAHLESLQRRGIGMLAICAPEEPGAVARQHEKIRARVMYLFRHTADEPGSQALLHAVLAFRQASGK
ncbi:MAG: hypothetical protein JNK97_05830 [Zoogloea sp.]|nr:hypothetical protein [Zoogloea sp.]